VTYLIAAYAIAAGGVLVYATCILRQRRALRTALRQEKESNPG
jgi:16S rRNA C967 or C1407 C5-methylase (RsmB/RsmF family)